MIATRHEQERALDRPREQRFGVPLARPPNLDQRLVVPAEVRQEMRQVHIAIPRSGDARWPAAAAPRPARNPTRARTRWCRAPTRPRMVGREIEGPRRGTLRLVEGTCRTHAADQRQADVGCPQRGPRVRIVRIEDHRMTERPGGAGEIRASGLCGIGAAAKVTLEGLAVACAGFHELGARPGRKLWRDLPEYPGHDGVLEGEGARRMVVERGGPDHPVFRVDRSWTLARTRF